MDAITDRCPVCGWDEIIGPICHVCAWSATTSADLEETCRRNDLAALLRVTRIAGDADTRRRLLAHCRGLKELSSEDIAGILRETAAAVEEEDRARRERRMEGTIEALVDRVAWGECRRLTVLDIGPAELVVREIVHGAGGAQPASRLEYRRPFDTVSSADPATPEGCFLLAGGGSESGTGPRSRALDDLVDELCASTALLDRTARGELAVIRRTVGWRTVDRFVERLRHRVLPIADLTRGPYDESLDRTVLNLCRGAPTQTAHHLVLAHVEPDGQVSLSPRQLFPPGRRIGGGDGDDADVLLDAPSPRGGAVRLPIVTDLDGPPARWTVHRAGRVTLPPGTSRLRVRLRGPGDLELGPLIGQDGSVTAVADAEPGHLGPVPASVPRAREVDVVLAMETAGQPAAVKARLALVTEVVDHLRRRARHLDGEVRLGVVGYGDHLEGIVRDPDEHLRVSDLGDPDAAVRHLTSWAARPAERDYGSALEEALAWAARRAWRATADRVVLIVGSRPPARSAQRVRRDVCCPHGLAWQTAVQDLGSAGVRCAAVLDPPRWHVERDHRAPVDRADQAWTGIATGGRWLLSDSPSAQVGEFLVPNAEDPGFALELALVSTAPVSRRAGGSTLPLSQPAERTP